MMVVLLNTNYIQMLIIYVFIFSYFLFIKNNNLKKRTKEINTTIKALYKNFKFEATINKTSINNQYALYISNNQLPLVV
jgi:preprotein translocase subunit YajC